jgi:hypothetical protein
MHFKVTTAVTYGVQLKNFGRNRLNELVFPFATDRTLNKR